MSLSGGPGSGGPGDALKAYTTCSFGDGLHLVQVDPLPAGVTSRTVDTASGPRVVSMVAGERVMFAYPGTDFFANVKAEVLPAEDYAQSKKALLDNLAYILKSSPSDKQNSSLASSINSFEVSGIDREELEGGVLGLYLMFDNATHVVTTFYFLNQEPAARKFQTLAEYAQLRDQFLLSYSGCVRKNMQ